MLEDRGQGRGARGRGERRRADRLARAVFSSLVADPGYPCLGARSVLNRDRATIRGYRRLGTAQAAQLLLADLAEFDRDLDLEAGFASLVAVFVDDDGADEPAFEDLLWRQLQALRDLDDAGWDPSVSDDPGDPRFAFSAGGRAYFVIGLHPAASRPARRARLPTLIFNPHEQFERLRAAGRFARMRDAIRRRDLAAHGSVNPMVADHGQGSEAAQYSGRLVPDGWRPRFSAHARRLSG